MVLNAFMTRRQLTARGRPARAPTHRLNGRAKAALFVAYALEIVFVFMAGSAHNAVVLVAGVVGLIACHVATYTIESNPRSLKRPASRPA